MKSFKKLISFLSKSHCVVCHLVSRLFGHMWQLQARGLGIGNWRYRKISILFKDIWICTYVNNVSPHCICFNGFKQDQLRWTIFNCITNDIFFEFKSYWQHCICFCLSPFLKNIQEVEQWNVDLFISLISAALNEVGRVSLDRLVLRNKGFEWYATLKFFR